MAKRLSEQQIIGRRGALIFGERTLASGLSFHETGALDTGIDGFLELRDPDTGEVKAQFVAAQIKTQKAGRLPEESDANFSFPCERRDLDYWLGSNIPVIMIIVHLESRLIWWKSVQDWFSDDVRRKSRKIVFQKVEDALTTDSTSRLAALIGTFARPGLMVPTRATETLTTNLLRVRFPDEVHVATCEVTPPQLREKLKERGRPPRDWVLYGQRLWSFSDLGTPSYRDVVEEGTDEWIATDDWLKSDGENTRRQLVHLLRNTLWQMVGDQLGFLGDRRWFYFKKWDGKHKRTYSYQSFEKKASRDVVAAYPKEGTPFYYRHNALRVDFLDIDGDWFMALEPTYYFSRDGFNEYSKAAERLSGIKRLESNQTVRGQIAMWKAFLIRKDDLFHSEKLHFEDVGQGSLDFGVPDDLWRSNEEEEDRKRMEQAQHELDF